MKLLVDEMIDGEIAVQLRVRGHDVVAVRAIPDLWGAKHLPLLTRAARGQGGALVTDNARDVVPIHRSLLASGEHHAGFVLASPSRFPRSLETIGRWVAALDACLRTLPPEATLDDTYVWLPA